MVGLSCVLFCRKWRQRPVDTAAVSSHGVRSHHWLPHGSALVFVVLSFSRAREAGLCSCSVDAPGIYSAPWVDRVRQGLSGGVPR